MRSIIILNQSSLVTPADFLAALSAVQLQVSRDFAPLWSGLSCQVSYYPGAQPAKVQAESITLLDDADQAGALGYHQDDNGYPAGFVFVRPSLDAGVPWTTCLSHELLEQLADPDCIRGVVTLFRGQLVLADEECADPVEADAYDIGSVPVSNFVTPAWFDANAPAGSRFDFLNRLRAPLTLTSGGYQGFTANLRDWSEYVQGRKRAHREIPHQLSRHCRRLLKQTPIHV